MAGGRRNSYAAAAGAPIPVSAAKKGMKKIEVTEDGDEEMEIKPTLRKVIANYLATSVVGSLLDVIGVVFALISCFQYIYGTYDDGINALGFIKALEWIITVFFFLELLLSVYIATRRLKHILSGSFWVDVLTLLPIMEQFLDAETAAEYAVYIKTLRVMRILRLYRITRILTYLESQATQQICEMIITMVTGLIFAAGLTQILEDDYAISSWEAPNTFGFYLYFIVVTSTTVGYGDFSPSSALGQFLICLYMIAAIAYVPNAANEIVRLAGLKSPYAKARYRPFKGISHVVVAGEFTASGLRDFFTEMFHKDHGTIELQVVLLLPPTPAYEIKQIILSPQYSVAVKYLEGSPMNDADLDRAAVDKAKCTFVLTNKFCDNPNEADASTILQALSIKRFIRRRTGKEILQCLQLMRPENKHHFTAFCGGADKAAAAAEAAAGSSKEAAMLHDAIPQDKYCIVCVDEIKMKLMAQTMLCPGLVAMMCNLVSSIDEAPLDKDAQEWASEYQEGSGYEVYLKPFPPSFTGVPFSEIALLVFEQLGATLFAIEISGPDLPARIVLNPGNWVLPDVRAYHVRGFLVAEDDDSADLSKLGDSYAPRGGKRKVPKAKSAVTPTGDDAEEKGSPKGKGGGGGGGGAGGGGKNWDKLRGDAKQKGVPKPSIKSALQLELAQKYFVREKPATLQMATVVRSLAEDLPAVTDHCIVAGSADNLYHFVLTLRAKHLGHIQTIVILHPEPPPPLVWDKINIFPQVVYLPGSALDGKDLLRAGVMKAERAVLFAPSQHHVAAAGGGGDDSSGMQNEAMIDADTIFIYQGISDLNPDCKIVTELVNYPNMAFLSPDMSKTKRMANTNPLASPQFASGAVYVPVLPTRAVRGGGGIKYTPGFT